MNLLIFNMVTIKKQTPPQIMKFESIYIILIGEGKWRYRHLSRYLEKMGGFLEE